MKIPITVVKRGASGEVELSYRGHLLERNDACICIEAEFASADRDLGYIHLRRGDRFREWFYRDRWFNIFRVSDVDSGELKGWYCNITRPPCIEEDCVSAEDLGLDVFVYPDGRTLLLDEDEFALLNLTGAERSASWEAVREIECMARSRRPPFDEIPSD